MWYTTITTTMYLNKKYKIYLWYTFSTCCSYTVDTFKVPAYNYSVDRI